MFRPGGTRRILGWTRMSHPENFNQAERKKQGSSFEYEPKTPEKDNLKYPRNNPDSPQQGGTAQAGPSANPIPFVILEQTEGGAEASAPPIFTGDSRPKLAPPPGLPHPASRSFTHISTEFHYISSPRQPSTSLNAPPMAAMPHTRC